MHRGDSTAFDELAAQHTTQLRRTLFRITQDCEAAMDAMQEALLRAWRNIGNGAPVAAQLVRCFGCLPCQAYLQEFTARTCE